MSARFGLALAFDTDDPEFVRGVELGRLWELLKAEAGELTETMHVANAEMALRVGEALGRTVTSAEADDGVWMTVTYASVP